MKTFKTLPFISVLLLIFTFIGCNITSSNHKTTKGSGTMKVQMTDAPGAYDAVYIDVKKIMIKPDSSYSDTTSTDQNGWITLSNPSKQVNLLKLRNGNTLQLGNKKLNAGTYSQIRLVLGQNNQVVINGTTHSLTTPSAQQSGLKLNVDATIKPNKVYNLLIDFNANKSIVQTGKSNKYILKPVLRAVSLQATATLSGTVKPDSVQTSVMAMSNSDTLSTVTDSTGSFSILGVPNGTYKVAFKPQSTALADTTKTGVMVQNHKDVNMGTIQLKKK
ncbi:MAG TPA: DUF4382 domain-containing protein [Balneolaceae bacterium]|nr:DUF4382 domain-containing protein [Balneolaceae bacterium]